MTRRRVDGVLLLDKPSGITSTAALSRVKRLYNAEKAGHTGTLDPLASGLLPICLGNATRFAGMLLDAPKRYDATIRFGIATTTYDAEGDITATHPVTFDEQRLLEMVGRLTGPQLQVPPAHSALKFEGRPHYEYARAGIDVPRPPRHVVIHAMRLVEWNAPDARVEVECSKGTYIRSLAARSGEELGCGAHLLALRRTGTGGFAIAQAITLEALEALDPSARDALLLPTATLVAHLPRIELGPAAARSFRHGQQIAVGGVTDLRDSALPAAAFEGHVLLGIAELRNGVLSPRRVLAGDST
ncbi:MAG TPA: tRNA pseudouridine(55) synthase TruB [Casimicrobiaceae bacterium]|nr:tRNA pseudouridine(55) synthase TruB [Casimicrobiaceae bacterium]